MIGKCMHAAPDQKIFPFFSSFSLSALFCFFFRPLTTLESPALAQNTSEPLMSTAVAQDPAVQLRSLAHSQNRSSFSLKLKGGTRVCANACLKEKETKKKNKNNKNARSKRKKNKNARTRRMQEQEECKKKQERKSLFSFFFFAFEDRGSMVGFLSPTCGAWRSR